MLFFVLWLISLARAESSNVVNIDTAVARLAPHYLTCMNEADRRRDRVLSQPILTVPLLRSAMASYQACLSPVAELQEEIRRQIIVIDGSAMRGASTILANLGESERDRLMHQVIAGALADEQRYDPSATALDELTLTELEVVGLRSTDEELRILVYDYATRVRGLEAAVVALTKLSCTGKLRLDIGVRLAECRKAGHIM